KPALLKSTSLQPANFDGTLSHQLAPPGPPGIASIGLRRNDSSTAFFSHWCTIQVSLRFSTTLSSPWSSRERAASTVSRTSPLVCVSMVSRRSKAASMMDCISGRLVIAAPYHARGTGENKAFRGARQLARGRMTGRGGARHQHLVDAPPIHVDDLDGEPVLDERFAGLGQVAEAVEDEAGERHEVAAGTQVLASDQVLEFVDRQQPVDQPRSVAARGDHRVAA